MSVTGYDGRIDSIAYRLACRDVGGDDSFMFSNTQMPGMDSAFPDVCKIPPFAVPAPFPNLAPMVTGEPTQFEVTILCMPAHNLATMRMLSQGEDAGVLGGVVSGEDMSFSMNIEPVSNVMMGGPPATKMTNMTMQNGGTTVGATLVPSQEVVLMLA